MNLVDELAEARVRIAELETQVDDLLRQHAVLMAERNEAKAAADAGMTACSEDSIVVQILQRERQRAEAEAAQLKESLIAQSRVLHEQGAEVFRYRAALEWIVAPGAAQPTTAKAYEEVARRALAFAAHAAEREPSDDISQWETNGGATPPDDANGDVGPY